MKHLDGRHRPWFRSERRWAVLSLGIAAAIALLVLSRPGEKRPVSIAPSAPPTAEALGHVNTAGGYTFSYPPSWELSDQGTVSEVSSPDRTAILSFGLGADGALQEASAQFVASLEGSYEDLEVTGTNNTEVGGHPATIVSAEATNAAGVSIRIRAITVAAPDRNYAISAFTAADALPELLEAVEEIIDSFRPTEA